MDSLHLDWTDFDENIRLSFRTIREEQRLFDVTLATDDGQYIQAHKVILTAGSNFFSDIFLKTSHHDKMLIYLKGIRSTELVSVTDFMYNGKVVIEKENLHRFLETAKELDVKGLQVDLPNTYETAIEDPEIGNKKIKVNETENDQYSKNVVALTEECSKLFDFGDYTSKIKVEKKIAVTLDNDGNLKEEIKKLIEMNENIWNCKVCGKTTTRKQVIESHAETHIEGISHVCHICNKTFSTRPGRRQHVFDIHSELFSCDICAKTGMNRKLFKIHKQKCVKELT